MISLCLRIFLLSSLILQLPIDRRVFCLMTAPFWAVIVVGMIERLRAEAAERCRAPSCGPVGRFSSKLETGTSGIDANVEVVMPLLMFVLPSRITLTPWSPSRIRSRSGKAAPPCETR